LAPPFSLRERAGNPMSLKTGKKSRSLTVTAVIPAYNEEKTIGKVVKTTYENVDEVIVVDDGSQDDTSKNAAEAGAKIIKHEKNQGILQAIQSGFKEAKGNIIITLDADGQHDPNDIPRLIQPIIDDEADLVIGTRKSFPHFSEKILTKITNLKVKVEDVCSGYRAIRSDIAEKMNLHGVCLCGTFVLEGHRNGARVIGIPITIQSRKDRKRRVKTKHFKQSLIVLNDLLKM
jgi:glycosyltransferase involved in cell wall biosynthesis